MSTRSVQAEITSGNWNMSNLDGMSLSELIEQLKVLATAWRKTPSRSYEFHDRVRCNELTAEINLRFGQAYYIVAAEDSPHNFQVYPPLPAIQGQIDRL